MKISRRSALGILATTATASAVESPSPDPQPAAGGALSLNWLSDSYPGLEAGVSWGVPWPRGTVSRTQTFALSANDGKTLPLQSWPLAYWPDGSIKFAGFATVTGASGPFRLAPGTPTAGTLKATQSAQAIEIAETFGVGVGLVSDTAHTGAVGRYAQWIAERGFAALVMVAGPLFMAYHGAKVTSLGTSPLAIGIPGPDGDDPLVLDMATSLTAAGRIRQAAAEGRPIPQGAAIDKEGRPTTDAAQAVTLLPLGGPKGSGLSLLFECLTGVMAGTPIITALAGLTGSTAPMQNAMVIVFNVANFRPLAEFRRDVGLLIGLVKDLPRREGFNELLLPGERGGREAELRRRNGIPLAAKLWRELNGIAQSLGAPPPCALS